MSAQIIISPVAFATTASSSNDRNEEENDNDKQKQQNTKNDRSKNDNNNNNNPSSSSSSLSSLETENHCSKDIVPQPNYIDKNGCVVPCPTTDNSQDNAIPVECPITTTTTTSLSPTTSATPSSQNQQNNLFDSSKGLTSSLDGNLLRPNLLGQDTRIDARPPKGAILTENSREIGLNCGDKIDNDKDGKIDSNDEDCESGKKTTGGTVTTSVSPEQVSEGANGSAK